jgi:hypothetical protein
MTGFDSKRKVAQAKLDDDDDTQVYADTLTIVYQRGFADGKQAAQRKPLDDYDIDVLANNIRTADPVTWWRQLARAIEAAHNIKDQP